MAMIGAALSTIISQLFYLGILMVYSKKYFNVHLELGHIIKPLLAAMVMFFVLTSMNKQIADFNLFIGIAEIFSGIIIYFAILFFIKGIRQEDVLLVKDTFLKFL